jgi:hypothetical protein
MPRLLQGHENEERILSRRNVVKGGLATAAGAAATFFAIRSGTTAVTPMDVKRPGFGVHSVKPSTVEAESTTTTSGE